MVLFVLFLSVYAEVEDGGGVCVLVFSPHGCCEHILSQSLSFYYITKHNAIYTKKALLLTFRRSLLELLPKTF